jgi:hypothetical protein
MAKRRKPHRNPDHGKGLLKRRAERPMTVESSDPYPSNAYELLDLEITWDPLPDAMVNALPTQTRERMVEIHEELQHNPLAVLPELRELSAKHPEVTSFSNWLIAALHSGSIAEKEEAYSLSKQMFHDKPEYFFARITLADILLERGEIEQAAELFFGPGHGITHLNPGRKTFHISEIRHWAFVCARIKLGLGEETIARSYRDLLNEVEPDSPVLRQLDSMLNGTHAMMFKAMANMRRLFEEVKERAARGKRGRGKKTLVDSPHLSPPSAKSGSDSEQLDLFE